MTKFNIALIAALLAAGAAGAQGWTATGSNGGSGSGSTDCRQSDGKWKCVSEGSWTGPNGRTSDWTTERVGNGSGWVRRTDGVGPRGREFSREVTVRRR